MFCIAVNTLDELVFSACAEISHLKAYEIIKSSKEIKKNNEVNKKIKIIKSKHLKLEFSKKK